MTVINRAGKFLSTESSHIIPNMTNKWNNVQVRCYTSVSKRTVKEYQRSLAQLFFENRFPMSDRLQRFCKSSHKLGKIAFAPTAFVGGVFLSGSQDEMEDLLLKFGVCGMAGYAAPFAPPLVLLGTGGLFFYSTVSGVRLLIDSVKDDRGQKSDSP